MDALELPIYRWDVTSRIDVKITIEQFPDTFVAYATNVEGVVIGEGDTYEAVLEDIESAIRFHLDTFGTSGVCGRRNRIK